MNIEIHQPHDTIFKAAFSHKQVMVDFLRSRLPQETLARIDLNTLTFMDIPSFWIYFLSYFLISYF